jgi:hypothetical protein
MTYIELGTQIGQLVTQKQEQYGDSFHRSGEILKVLYPNGVQPHQYVTMLAVVRIVDKLFRIATASPSDMENPGMDIAGYGLLLAHKDEP